jgi:hypothetical protein
MVLWFLIILFSPGINSLLFFEEKLIKYYHKFNEIPLTWIAFENFSLTCIRGDDILLEGKIMSGYFSLLSLKQPITSTTTGKMTMAMRGLFFQAAFAEREDQ